MELKLHLAKKYASSKALIQHRDRHKSIQIPNNAGEHQNLERFPVIKQRLIQQDIKYSTK